MLAIWKDTKKLCNIYSPYVDSNGTKHLRVPEELYEFVQNDPVPQDYTPDSYTIQEDWETTTGPYTIYVKKSNEQIAQLEANKLLQQIRDLEQQRADDMQKAIRQSLLAFSETLAATQNITPEQLYISNKTYREIHDLEQIITPIRAEYKTKLQEAGL